MVDPTRPRIGLMERRVQVLKLVIAISLAASARHLVRESKREKRCADLFDSLIESSQSRVTERGAIGIPGSQARSSRSSGDEIEEHPRFRSIAGPPENSVFLERSAPKVCTKVCTVLQKGIILPTEQVESALSPEYTENTSSFTRIILPTEQVEGAISPEYTENTSSFTRIILPTEQVEGAISPEFTENTSSFTRIILPTEQVEGAISPEFTENTSSFTRIILPTEQVESAISPEYTENTSSFTRIILPTEQVEGAIFPEFSENTSSFTRIISPTEQMERAISPECTEKWSSVTIDEEAASAIETRVAEKVIDISIKNDTELRQSLIDRCEKTVLGIVEQLCAGKLPSVSYKMPTTETLMEQQESLNPESVKTESSPATWAGFEACSVFETPESMDTESIKHASEESAIDILGHRRVVNFRSERSRNKLALMMTTMAKVHGLLNNGRTETRRSLYYELKSDEAASRLINNQKQVDGIVNNLANLLECSPWEMGLVASAKGLAAGEMTLRLSDDSEINFDSLEGVLIPRTIYNVTSIRTKAKLVIVVEKDTVFQKLLDENCPNRLSCILITGKGTPDVATRMLVKILAEKVELPVYLFVDADPYGVEIMFTYKYGSIALSCAPESLACPSIRWLGLRPSELSEDLMIPTIPLTDADISKLATLQDRPYVDEMLSKELEIMKNGKSEIEAIGGCSHDSAYILAYLKLKIDSENHI